MGDGTALLDQAEFSTRMLGTAENLLQQAQLVMQGFLQDSEEACQLQCSAELATVNRVSKQGTAAEKVLDCLAGSVKALQTWAPTLTSLMNQCVTNTYDAKMSNPRVKQFTDEQRSRWESRKKAQALSLLSLLARLRGKHACPPSTIRRSLELRYYHTPDKIWRMQAYHREVLTETWVQKVLATAELRAWRPPGFIHSNRDIELHVRDNLEWWLKIKHNRHKDGKLLKSDIKHTVTGEVFYTPASLTADIVSPDLGHRCQRVRSRVN